MVISAMVVDEMPFFLLFGYAPHEPAADFDIAGPAEHGVRVISHSCACVTPACAEYTAALAASRRTSRPRAS